MEDEGAHPSISPGEIVGGKYRIGEIIGVGGTGVVFEAAQFHLGRSVAIKFLAPHACGSPESIGRFLREARAVAQLDSDHVVRVLDTGTLPEGTPYLVMERLRGSDLARLLARRGPLPCGEAARYLIEGCRGLEAAHRLGLVHRDSKPQNLFVAERSDGTTVIKVLDFGISKVIEQTNSLGLDGVSTARAAILGSPPYMPPEQLRSAREVDTRADIWALGVVLFELLTGVRPFGGETLAALARAVEDDPTPSLRAHRSDVPAALERVFRRCLEKDPEARYASARELADDLETLVPTLSGTSMVSVRRTDRIVARPWRTAALLATAAVALVAMTVYASSGSHPPATPTEPSNHVQPTPGTAAALPPVPVTSEASACPPPALPIATAAPPRPSTRTPEPRVSARPASPAAPRPTPDPTGHPLFFPR